MSIRLKKVEWVNKERSLWQCTICGWWYECWTVDHDGTARWGAQGTKGRVFQADSLDAAKAACEQHALERIREAVEEYLIYDAAEKERQLELCRLGRKVQELAEEARDSRASPFRYNEADKVIDAFDNALTIEEMGLDAAVAVEDVNAEIEATGSSQHVPLHIGETTEKVEVVGETFQVTAPVLYERLNELVTDLNNLISDSAGVAGLHLNGDLAPWDELTEGGRFGGWLGSLAKAEEVLHAYKKIDGSNSPEIPDSWQPIETAPELEQVLIAYRGVNPNKPLIDVAFYHPDAKSWDVCGQVRVNPARVFAWMPLPKPPKEGEHG